MTANLSKNLSQNARHARTARFATGSKRALALLCASLLSLAATACGTATVSTSGYKGEARAVATAVANLQSDATAGAEKKICANDLSAQIVAQLGGGKRCEATIKDRLAEVDSFELSVESIQLTGNAAAARVRSVKAGKSRLRTLTLVKEGSKWKTSSLA